MTEIELHPFEANDRDWLVANHADHYAREEDFDASFGALVAQIVDAYLADHDPSHEAGWIVWQGGRRLGSIFCVRLDETRAKLRLFLLVPEARGTGLGRVVRRDLCRQRVGVDRRRPARGRGTSGAGA